MNNLKQRRVMLRSVCARYSRFMSRLRPTGVVWSLKSPVAHYCITPKAGCTTWKQIFRFLSGDVRIRSTVDTPSDIDRMFVHYYPLKNINATKLIDPVIQARMTHEFSFMISRNPYTRLWSAYIDKFLLPDFWRTDALNMIRAVRQNASEYDLKCANNLSFQEFLKFIVIQFPVNLNEHWQPIFKLCNPCRIDYDVIGTQETFLEDTKYILKRIGLANITTKMFAKENRIKEEVEMLTKYNFNLETRIREGCFDKLDVAHRLWKAFQFNGYIHRSIAFPWKRLEMSNFTSAPVETFLKQVILAMNFQRDSDLVMGSQKKDMMLEAYQQTSSELLSRVQAVYNLDFKLFGYDVKLI
ncbi:hypothetical protein DPMN_105609 [Dreissena polymorpha]|uniref:Carbohydrate sulfotransferase n=1 Tax=Dreissena polymorpha TaxID=45954 RepID=A0A9D4K3I6_DREPO|nr:hypothetical protein DPMN_105609 [Dreissena polymorpha]